MTSRHTWFPLERRLFFRRGVCTSASVINVVLSLNFQILNHRTIIDPQVRDIAIILDLIPLVYVAFNHKSSNSLVLETRRFLTSSASRQSLTFLELEAISRSTYTSHLLTVFYFLKFTCYFYHRDLTLTRDSPGQERSSQNLCQSVRPCWASETNRTFVRWSCVISQFIH